MNAIAAALQYARRNGMNGNGAPACPPGCTALGQSTFTISSSSTFSISTLPPQLSDTSYNHTREMHITEAFPSSTASESVQGTRPESKTLHPRRVEKMEAKI